jgi:hypothetical protein
MRWIRCEHGEWSTLWFCVQASLQRDVVGMSRESYSVVLEAYNEPREARPPHGFREVDAIRTW